MGTLPVYHGGGSGKEGHEGLPDRFRTMFRQDVTRVANVKG